MAVAVDHPGDDRGAAGVDHLSVAGVLLRVGWTDPCDAAAVHEHAHTELERGRARIGKRRIAIQRGHCLLSRRILCRSGKRTAILAPKRIRRSRRRRHARTVRNVIRTARAYPTASETLADVSPEVSADFH